MLEYAFFHVKPFEAFVEKTRNFGLEPDMRVEADYWEVRLAEDLSDDVMEQVEALYERMMEWNQQLHEAEERGDQQTAGVVVNLKQGEVVYAQVDPVLLSKILSVLTPDEFGQVVDAVVDAVENPDSRSLCQRQSH